MVVLANEVEDDGILRQVHRQRLDFLFAKAPVALATVVVASVFLAVMVREEWSAEVLIAWVAGLHTITVLRVLLVWAYRRRSKRFGAAFWERAFMLGALLNGLGWGAGGLLFVQGDVESAVVVAFVVGGMVAGASSSTATSMPSFWAFALPALGPVVAGLFVGTDPHPEMGILLVWFGVAMTLLARSTGRTVVRGMQLQILNKAMSEELSRRSRERAGRLQLLLDHAGVVTIVADPSTSRIVDASKNVKDLMGRAAGQVRNERFVDVVKLARMSTLDMWADLVNAARRGEHTRSDALQVAQGIRHLELTATVRHISGAEYVLVVLTDVTDLRELEAQLARSSVFASLGTLGAGIAHEVNNPLASVVGNLEHLRDAVSSQAPALRVELGPPVDDALHGAKRIGRIVSDLMATAQPAAVTGSVEGSVDPKAAVLSCLGLMDNELRHRARMELDLDDTPPVQADALRVNQVLLNLLLNAAQAIDGGKAAEHCITVSVRHEPADAMVAISVEDTGHGIESQHLDRVFEPFFTTRPPGRGTGLGLSVCQAVVTGLGGTLTVQSAAGTGSRFELRLPAASASEAPAVVNLKGSAPAGASLRVLVVDDDALVARALSRLLSAHRVTVVAGVRDALEALDADLPVDVILCDLMMPDLGGEGLYRRLVSTRSDLLDRIVFMTGGAFTEETLSFLKTVDNPCLTKPFDGADIERIFDGIVARDRRQPGLASGVDPAN